MNSLRLHYTSKATFKPIGGGYLLPVNVTRDGLCLTINTRYDGLNVRDILDLKQYSKTVVLIEYE